MKTTTQLENSFEESPFDACNRAYKEGIKAAQKGIDINDNPYLCLTGRLNQTLQSSWWRGWLAGK